MIAYISNFQHWKLKQLQDPEQPLMSDNVLNWLWLYHTPGMWQVEGSGSPTTIQGFVYQVSVITVVCGPRSLLSKGLRLNPLNNLSQP